jgi:hypothetical protein
MVWINPVGQTDHEDGPPKGGHLKERREALFSFSGSRLAVHQANGRDVPAEDARPSF